MIKIDKMINENTTVAPIKYGYICSTTFLTIGWMISSVTIWTFSLLWSSSFIVWRSLLTTTWNDIKFKRTTSFISIEQTYGEYLLYDFSDSSGEYEKETRWTCSAYGYQEIYREYWPSDWSVCDMLGTDEKWGKNLPCEVRTYVSRILPDEMVSEKIYVPPL